MCLVGSSKLAPLLPNFTSWLSRADADCIDKKLWGRNVSLTLRYKNIRDTNKNNCHVRVAWRVRCMYPFLSSVNITYAPDMRAPSRQSDGDILNRIQRKKIARTSTSVSKLRTDTSRTPFPFLPENTLFSSRPLSNCFLTILIDSELGTPYLCWSEDPLTSEAWSSRKHLTSQSVRCCTWCDVCLVLWLEYGTTLPSEHVRTY